MPRLHEILHPSQANIYDTVWVAGRLVILRPRSLSIYDSAASDVEIKILLGDHRLLAQSYWFDPRSLLTLDVLRLCGQWTGWVDFDMTSRKAVDSGIVITPEMGQYISQYEADLGDYLRVKLVDISTRIITGSATYERRSASTYAVGCVRWDGESRLAWRNADNSVMVLDGNLDSAEEFGSDLEILGFRKL